MIYRLTCTNQVYLFMHLLYAVNMPKLVRCKKRCENVSVAMLMFLIEMQYI